MATDNEDSFNVYMCTWNVAGEKPPKDLSQLLSLYNKQYPHCYVIGLQEINSSATALVSDTLEDDAWTSALTKVLKQKNFVRISSIRLMGIHLVVFVMRNILHLISNVETQYTRTGLNGMWGNKGGVSVRMDIGDTNVCFVNSHLAAGQKNVVDRIEDFDRIIDTQRFKDEFASEIFFHDYVFWIGDLNFRIDGFDKQEIQQLVSKQQYSQLFKHDQLNKCFQEGLIFPLLKEGPIVFPPSYKFDKGKQNYDTSKKQRLPAWCDRILYYADIDTFPNLDITQHSYTSLPMYVDSDHKPVISECTIKIMAPLYEPPLIFLPIKQWTPDKNGEFSFVIPRGSTFAVSKWDWIGLYRKNFSHFKDYVTYIWAPKSGRLKKDGSIVFSCKIYDHYLNHEGGSYLLAYYPKDHQSPIVYSKTFVIASVGAHSSDSSPSSDSCSSQSDD